MEALSVVVDEHEPVQRINSVWYSSDEDGSDADDDAEPKQHRMSFEVGMVR